MNVKALIAVLLLASPALAQGFAGLGTEAEGFALPDPDYQLQFPADHGAHPDFRIEWWYLTANLTDETGRPLGAQWTLFRSALAPEEREGWTNPQVFMGHAAITTPDAHYHAERFARGGIGQAGVTADPFLAWIDEWEMRSTATEGDQYDALRLTASGPDFAYDLDLAATGPLVLHGQNGYSVKSAQGQASHYYSQPHYRVTGTIRTQDGETAVTGTAWLDREWSSQPLAEDQTGWDWFSLSFETGEKMMAFRLRDSGPGFTSGTWIAPDGTAEPFSDGALQLAPQEITAVAGRAVPTEWALSLPDRGLSVTVSAVNPESWMGTSVPYWEGPVTVTGSHAGLGYLEMTGYD